MSLDDAFVYNKSFAAMGVDYVIVEAHRCKPVDVENFAGALFVHVVDNIGIALVVDNRDLNAAFYSS
jgi:hypothetical protein